MKKYTHNIVGGNLNTVETNQITLLESKSMTTSQKIEAAKQRIEELERLIKAWKNKS